MLGAIADFFEDSKLGWWRKDEGGGGNFEEEDMYFPILQRGARVGGGEIVGRNDEGGKWGTPCATTTKATAGG